MIHTRRSPLRRWFQRFRRDERGSISIETVLMVPILIWVYIGMFVYFDAFRSKAQLEKATFTIADAVSRETHVSPDYIDSMYELHGLLTHSRHRTGIRISSIRWNDDRNRYYRVWTQRRGQYTDGGGHLRNVRSLSNRQLRSSEYTDRLPETILHQERLILVESWAVYEPPFNLSWDAYGEGTMPFGEHLQAFEMSALIFVRPRFEDRVCWIPDLNNPTQNRRC